MGSGGCGPGQTLPGSGVSGGMSISRPLTRRMLGPSSRGLFGPRLKLWVSAMKPPKPTNGLLT